VYPSSPYWTLPHGSQAMNDLLLLVNSLAMVLLVWLCLRVKKLDDATRSSLSEVRAIIVMWELAVQTMDEHNKRHKA